MRINKITSVVCIAICNMVLADSVVGTANTTLPKDVIPQISVSNLNYASLFEADREREQAGQAPQFAVPFEQSITPLTNGIWERLDLETQRWSLRVNCSNALSMNVGFARFNMPASGSMTIRSTNGDFRIRPFTADDNKLHGQLWTPIVPGGEVLIEITVRNEERQLVVKGIELTSINAGYRWIHDAAGRGSSESCNIDVVCPEGDAWWNEIPSVGVYTLNGYLTCTGVMMNNTAQDQTPYFLTANHCGVTSSSDSSIVVYWNHQNSYCRAPGSSDSGGNGNGTFNQFTSGSTMRATRSYTDFTLTELSSNPDPSYGITYSGWSRASSASLGAGIHHPEAAEKRISFPDTVQASSEYWDVNWGEGRTAPGSSGSPLYDGNHRVIGQLCCGSSYCPNDLNDYYGRSMNQSWDGSSSSSLGTWLDPVGSDSQYIDTLVPGGGGDPQGACCVGTSCTYGTEADCDSIGGLYQGDYISCTTYPCGGAPEGACCIATECSLANASDCSLLGGSYQGDTTTCIEGICDNGGCEVGYSPDCLGTCFEDSVFTDWSGDGFCDNGAYVPSDYGYGGPEGVAIYLNCNQFDCDGGDCTDCDGGGGGECPAGEIEDCNGNCCPDFWVADGYCDDGTYEWNGNPIYLNCNEFDCDGGDCTGCDGGGGQIGACCFPDGSCFEITGLECTSSGGEYQNDGSACADANCSGGGGECPADWTEDCQGTCFPNYVYDGWVGDSYCDDGAYIPSDYGCDECPAGVAMWLNCEEFDCDGGDCECAPSDPLGACCFGADCFETIEAECANNGGQWEGDNSTCSALPCAVPCPADADASGVVDVSDILYIVGAWGSSDESADVNGDGIVSVSDILEVVSSWGPCP